MKPIPLLFVLLLTAAGFGAGLFIGRKAAPAPLTAATVGALDDSAAPAPLPIITAPRRAATPGDKLAARMSLAEVETAFSELRSLSRSRLWERMSEISKAIDPADISAALALVAKLPPDLQSLIRSSLIARWAETDPRSAMEAASSLKNFNERHQAILSVLRGWAKDDPQGAAAWIEQLPPGRLRTEAPGMIARALAEKDPEAAFALVKNSKQNRNSGYGAMYELFDTWAAKDPATAALRAQEIKGSQERQNAYQSIARRWAEKDVQAALTWAKNLPEGRDRSSAMSAVLGAWAATDPRAAAEQALTLPAGQARNQAISTLASQWAQNDLNSAVAWAQQLPDGQLKQQAMSSLGYQ